MKRSPQKPGSPLRDDVRKLLSKFILMDDDFMRVVLKDIRCTEYILQTILRKPKLHVKEQVLQEDLKNLQGRSVILDCFCTDDNGTVYNIELQNKRYGASPLRARYHAGIIDMHILKAGENFTRLPESYVIFPTLTVYIVKKPCKSLKSSGLQSFFLCYQMCVQIFIF